MKRFGVKQLLCVLVVFMLVLTGCGGESGSMKKASAEFADTNSAQDTWLVYWYLCGTDLESEYGAASADLAELMSVQLPSNVKVLIETGGANRWQTNGVPSNAVGRFLYDENGLTLLQSAPDANMGDGSTLADFLRFGKEHYTADHQVLVFWDHGGGSTVGLCLDERYQKLMSLDELRQAIGSVYEANAEKPPFEIIGFDACLMSTIDTAAAIYGYSRYMVASEEVEPGNGWKYDGWVGALGGNPAMSGAGLGKVICDTYMDGCKENASSEMATLSVTDISKVPELERAYGAFAVEALQKANQNPRSFFSEFARDAENSENYGGNTREQGYTNMVDLGALVKNAQDNLPQSTGALHAAVSDAVLYRVYGPYRTGGSGIAAFYSYDGKPESWQAFANLSMTPLPMKCLYYYLLFGQMPDEAQQYLSGAVYEPDLSAPAAVPSPAQSMPSASSAPTAVSHSIFNLASLEDTPVDIDSEGSAFVRLSPEAMDLLTSVHCQFFYFDPKEDIMLYLGSDSNINADWEKGIFKDNFFGKWMMLDGHPVYVEITYEGDDYNLYSVPVKLNGVECNLQISYSFKDEKYTILGARRGLEPQSGVADRNLIKLKAGDKVTTLHYGMTITEDDTDYTQVEVETFTLGVAPKFTDEDVGDGKYGYYFEFVDPLNNSAWSQMVTYTIKNGEITTSVGTDMTGADIGMTGAGNVAYNGNNAANGMEASTDGYAPSSGSIADSMTGGGYSGNTGSADYDTGYYDASAGGGSIADSLAR